MNKIPFILAAALVAALSLPAAAQYATGTGRGLDNNLQVGSGGMNAAQAQPDFRARNDVMTRNVAGLGYFHAGIPYSASGDFSGGLPSDNLARFRAQRTPNLGGPSTALFLPMVAGVPTVSVYRNFAPTTAGQVQSGTIPMPTPGSNVVIRPEQPLFGPTGGTQASGLVPENVIGAVPQANGQLLQIQASPLTGVRALSTPLLLPTSGTPTFSGQARPGVNTDINPGVSPGANPGLNPAANTSDLIKGPAEYPGLPEHAGQWIGLGVNLGPEARVQAERAGMQTGTLDQRIAEIQAGMFSPLGAANVKPGEDVYLDILSRARRNREIAAGLPAQPPPGAVPLNQMANVPEVDEPAATAGRVAALAPPTAEQLASARTQRRQALALTRGVPTSPLAPDELTTNPLPGNPVGPVGPVVPETPGAGRPALTPGAANGTQEPGAAENPRIPGMGVEGPNTGRRPARGGPPVVGVPGTPGAPGAGLLGAGTPGSPANAGTPATPSVKPVAGGSSMEQLIATLRSTAPPLPSMAGRRNDAVNQSIRLAESSLAAGLYFDAMNHYQDALDLDRRNPMARVGLMHAQIGAGMIFAAAGNLHAVMDDHPELISVRYQAGLLPSAPRLQWVRQQIETANSTSQDPKPAFLLAYLGYQLNAPSLVEYGLDLAQARDPRDPLFDLIRGLWTRTGGPPPGATTRPTER